MNRKALVLILLLVISFCGFSQSGELTISTEKVQIAGKAYYLHKVDAGQTSWSISKAYNILVSELAEENPVVFDSLSIGQELRIPIIKGRNYSADEIKYADKFIYHYIEQGQTAYSVSRLYNSHVDTLYKWNTEAKTSFVPGQVLRFPKINTDISEIAFLLNPPKEEGNIILDNNINYIFHEVVKGNTLYSISKLYDVPQESIIKLNHGSDKVLSIGMLLKIKSVEVAVVEDTKMPDHLNDEKIITEDKVVAVDNEIVPDKNISKKDSNVIAKDSSKVVKLNIVGHTIKKGESLYSLSIKYNVTKKDILKHNKGLTSLLTIGDKILIPQPHFSNNIEYEEIIEEADEFLREDKRYYYHKVEAGESLSDITRFYHIKTRKVKKANPFIKERDIIENDIIRIPKKDIRDIRLVSRMIKERFYPPIIEEVITLGTKDTIPEFKLEGYDYFENRDTIRIALMLPLFLYENDTLALGDTLVVEEEKSENNSRDFENVLDAFAEPEVKIFSKSQVFLEFYEGFLIAIDSLNNLGVNMKLYTYDTEKSVDTVKNILAQPEIARMNLIIGPVYEENINLVNNYAKDKGIPVISPLISGNSDSIDNKLFFRSIPKTETQIQRFSKVISEYYHKNIIVMHYGTDREKENIEFYKKYLLPELYLKTDSSKIKFSVIELDRNKAFDIIKPRKDENEKDVFDHPIKNALIEEIPNLVIIPSKNRGLVSNTIRQLNTLYEEVVSDYEITVAGFSNARDFENIDLQYLHNLEFHTFSPSFVDYSHQNVKEFVAEYRKRFEAEPSQFSIQGYDLLWYFVNSYVYYGPEFYNYNNLIYSDTTIECLQNDFDFILKTDTGVFENQQIYVLKYEQNYDVLRIDDVLERPEIKTIMPSKPKKEIEEEIKEEKTEPIEDKNSFRLYRKPK